HRDVSLAGVVLSIEGIPKLHDLALASAQPQHSTDPATNAQYTRRLDVFGVGATLFKLTTGHSAWGGGHRQADPSHPGAAALRPSEIVPGYPPDLELIVLAAIEARTADPFPSAQQLSDLPEDFAAGPANRSTAAPAPASTRGHGGASTAQAGPRGRVPSAPGAAARTSTGPGRHQPASRGAGAQGRAPGADTAAPGPERVPAAGGRRLEWSVPVAR